MALDVCQDIDGISNYIIPIRFVTKIFSTQHKNDSQKKKIISNLNMAFTYIMNFLFLVKIRHKNHTKLIESSTNSF